MLNFQPGLLTNHSGRKTVAQILEDANVPEDAIMGVTGHKSIQDIRAYKEINKRQHLATMNTLIDAIEPLKPSILSDSTSKNVNIDFNLESEIPTINKI